MNASVTIQQLLPPVLIIAVGVPLVMILLGELSNWLEDKGLPIVFPLRIVRNWVVPLVACFILFYQVLAISRSSPYLKIIETLLLIAIIYVALNLLNILLFEDAPKESWQTKVPQLMRDLARAILVLVGISIVLSTVWGADLAGFLTALGFGSLVLGLALQDSLGNIFSGLSLLFEQPFSVGDWIKIGEYEGTVVAINWRSVYLQGEHDEMQVVPNSTLAKETFINFSRTPERTHNTVINISFSYDDPPKEVIKILTQETLRVEGISHKKPPSVWIESYGDFAINYKIQIFVDNPMDMFDARDEMYSRIWYIAQRNELNMPYPTRVNVPYQDQSQGIEEKQNKNIESAIKKIVGFASLTPEILEKILKNGRVCNYVKGEIIIYQEEPLSGLYIILKGAVKLTFSDLENRHLVTLGELFGEKASLLSERISDVTVQAIDETSVFLIDIETLNLALRHSPRLSQEIGEIMELRRRMLNSLTTKNGNVL